jgi:hypothetical protein
MADAYEDKYEGDLTEEYVLFFSRFAVLFSSWLIDTLTMKIPPTNRRSATNLLTAIIGTRPELLTAIYKEISPALISKRPPRSLGHLHRSPQANGSVSGVKDDASPRGK